MNRWRCKICGTEYENMPRICETPGCNNRNPAMWDVLETADGDSSVHIPEFGPAEPIKFKAPERPSESPVIQPSVPNPSVSPLKPPESEPSRSKQPKLEPSVPVRVAPKEHIWALNTLLAIVAIPNFVVVLDFIAYSGVWAYFPEIFVLPAILLPIAVIAALVVKKAWIKGLVLILGEAWATYFACSGVVGRLLDDLPYWGSRYTWDDASFLFALLAILLAAMSLSVLFSKRHVWPSVVTIVLAVVWDCVFLVSGVIPSMAYYL